MAREVLRSYVPINSKLVISVSDLKSKYFFGVPILSPDGSLMSDEDISFFIESATKEIEAEIDIKLKLQVINETKSFSREEYNNWSYIRTSYPVVCIGSLTGFVGKVKQVEFPLDWLSIQKSNDGIRFRKVNIVPNSNNSAVTNSIVYAGVYPQMGYFGSRNIPDYWEINYTTGFNNVPEDLIKVIGMKAAIPIYDILGDLILGAGIASQSLGLDGLSQSISSTSSATNAGYGARITSYQKTVKDSMPALKKKYGGVIFDSL